VAGKRRGALHTLGQGVIHVAHYSRDLIRGLAGEAGVSGQVTSYLLDGVFTLPRHDNEEALRSDPEPCAELEEGREVWLRPRLHPAQRAETDACLLGGLTDGLARGAAFGPDAPPELADLDPGRGVPTRSYLGFWSRRHRLERISHDTLDREGRRARMCTMQLYCNTQPAAQGSA